MPLPVFTLFSKPQIHTNHLFLLLVLLLLLPFMPSLPFLLPFPALLPSNISPPPPPSLSLSLLLTPLLPFGLQQFLLCLLSFSQQRLQVKDLRLVRHCPPLHRLLQRCQSGWRLAPVHLHIHISSTQTRRNEMWSVAMRGVDLHEGQRSRDKWSGGGGVSHTGTRWETTTTAHKHKHAHTQISRFCGKDGVNPSVFLLHVVFICLVGVYLSLCLCMSVSRK